jgi:homoserine O-acetyltransferase
MSDLEAYMTSFTHQKVHISSGGAGAGCSLPIEGVLPSGEPLKLHHGGTIESPAIGWRMTGATIKPVVLALGGISAHRRVFETGEEQSGSGWWSEIVGPGRALDTDRFRILSFDYLGGSGETSGPNAKEPFPAISTYDQAEVLLRLMNHLGIDRLHAIVGASYGGMVALAFAERYPARVAQLVVISAADRASPMSTAWRSIQRRLVRFGLETGEPEKGLALARALAMATYRSAEEFSERFAGLPQLRDDRFVFPVEDYLMARGADYARRYRPDSFLTLSESIDLHSVDVTRVRTPVTAIAVKEDQLVPVMDIRKMCDRLPNAHLHEMSSVFGHDAFLKEQNSLKSIFSSVLGES